MLLCHSVGIGYENAKKSFLYMFFAKLPLSGFRVALPFVDCWQLTMVVATHSHTKNDSFFMAVQVIRVGRTRQEELVSRFCGQGCKVEEGVASR